MQTYILAVDQSTSGTKALIVDKSGNIIVKRSIEHKQYYPQYGWVEHDPIEIYENVISVSRQVLGEAGIASEQLAALTITNQRETALVWDRTTGNPIYNAIVWQCQRTSVACTELKDKGYEKMVQEKTGLLLDPYFSATKWRWFLENVEGAREKLREGKLLAGTIETWLIWKLTGGKIHATDYTNASRTSLFNIHTLKWDDELCSLFGVPLEILPSIKSSNEVFGYTQDQALFDAQIPISGIIGDSQAALFGHLCFQPGMAKATYGTGTSVLMNVGETPPQTVGDGLVCTVAWGMDGKVNYALEAVIRTTGDSLKWVRDNLGLFSKFEELESTLKETPDNDGVYLVPAFVGLGAPYWNPNARAAIVGMSRVTGKAHIIRAALESIAYQVRDAIEIMRDQSGLELQHLRVDGGPSGNELLMQFQADILHKTLVKSGVDELSAMGSAYMGGLGTRYWASTDDIAHLQHSYKVYESKMLVERTQCYYLGWKKAVSIVLKEA